MSHKKSQLKPEPKRITKKRGLALLKTADLLDLGIMADRIRHLKHPDNVVTFIVDRNINYTNICINRCTFCAFWRNEKDPDAYVLSKKELFKKIKETLALGGTQVLMQGGLHPKLNLPYYINLLSSIKKRFPVHVHGFSPPEISYIADRAGLTLKKTLEILRDAGLDSIPGGGAEILSDRIRKKISPRKIGKNIWLNVMEEAHTLGMKTTATMMFGSIEKSEDIIDHLDAIRQLQDKTNGFTAFIPWSFQPGNTKLGTQSTGLRAPKTKHAKLKTLNSKLHPATAIEYLKILALSRIYLDNIPNIQSSWVTQGTKTAQIALRFGANDFGSTMIEENVVAAAGIKYRASPENIRDAISTAGFKPAQRDMYYNIIRRRFVS
jgi:cyclic dehypoxanthinyl futalosine synthase